MSSWTGSYGPSGGWEDDDDGEVDPKSLTEEQIIDAIRDSLSAGFVNRVRNLNEFETYLTLERCNTLIELVENHKTLQFYPNRLLGLGCPTDYWQELEYMEGKEKRKRRKMLGRGLIMGVLALTLINLRKFGINFPKLEALRDENARRENPIEGKPLEKQIYLWVKYWRDWLYALPRQQRRDLFVIFDRRGKTDEFLPLETLTERLATYEAGCDKLRSQQIASLIVGWDEADTLEERIKKISNVIGQVALNAISGMSEFELAIFVHATSIMFTKGLTVKKLQEAIGQADLDLKIDLIRYEAMIAYGYHCAVKFGLPADVLLHSSDKTNSHKVTSWLGWWVDWMKNLSKEDMQKMLSQMALHDEVTTNMPDTGEWLKTYDPNKELELFNSSEVSAQTSIRIVPFARGGSDESDNPIFKFK